MLKITALKLAFDAECAVISTDDSFKADEARYSASFAAYWAEREAAASLRAKYEAMPETAAGSGITNAQDTYANENGDEREMSTEFWQCAIDSLQLMRDSGDTSVSPW